MKEREATFWKLLGCCRDRWAISQSIDCRSGKRPWSFRGSELPNTTDTKKKSSTDLRSHCKATRREREHVSHRIYMSDKSPLLRHPEDRQPITLFGKKIREPFHTALLPCEGVQSQVSLIFLNNSEKSGLLSWFQGFSAVFVIAVVIPLPPTHNPPPNHEKNT